VKARASRRAQAGYSLIEVLITLVIVSLITGLVFSGIGGAARLSLSLSDASDRLDRATLAAEWFRASVAGAMPAEGPAPPQLIGAAKTLRLTTVTPLHARPGSPRQVTWRIVEQPGGDVDLVYDSDGVSWTVARTRDREPRFVYRGAGDEDWRDKWSERAPPALVGLEDFFAAPILVRPRTRSLPDQPADRPFEART